jgi:hypothetical protein
MADQITKGDDFSNNFASAAAEAGQKACESFHKEFFSTADRNTLNSGADGRSTAGLNRQQESNSIYGAIAEGITNAVKDGAFQAAGRCAENGLTANSMVPWDLGDKNPEGSHKPHDASGAATKIEGVKLPTGDLLFRQAGGERLITPNGDQVSVNPSGTFSIKGDVKSVASNKAGETTVTFADGSTVTFDKEGILGVTRDNQAVSFARKQHPANPGHAGQAEQVKPLPDLKPGDGPARPEQPRPEEPRKPGSDLKPVDRQPLPERRRPDVQVKPLPPGDRRPLPVPPRPQPQEMKLPPIVIVD